MTQIHAIKEKVKGEGILLQDGYFKFNYLGDFELWAGTMFLTSQ